MSEALLKAAAAGDLATVESLIKQNADVNYKQQGEFPLRIAAYNGHFEVVKLLLEKGAKLSLKEAAEILEAMNVFLQNNIFDLIADAFPEALFQNTDLVQEILAKNNTRALTKLITKKEFDTAGLLATTLQKKEILLSALNNDNVFNIIADYFPENLYYHTDILIKILKDNNNDALKKLLSKQNFATSSFFDSVFQENYCLILAVSNNNFLFLQFFIDSGGDIFKPRFTLPGKTELFSLIELIAKSNNSELKEKIIKNNPNMKEKIIDELIKQKPTLFIDTVMSKNFELATQLLSKCDPNKRIALGSTKVTPLGRAIASNNESALNFLLNIAHVNPFLITTTDYVTPIKWARNLGNTPFVKILTQQEAQQYEFYQKENPNYFKFLKRIEIITKAGHIMGLSSNITTHNEIGEEIPISTVGGNAYNSNLWLREALNKHVLKLKQTANKEDEERQRLLSHFNTIDQAFSLEEKFLRFDGSKSPTDLFQDFIHDKMVVLPISLPKHAITITLYKNHIILCNRGEGGFGGETIIYSIPDKTKLTQEWLTNIIQRPVTQQITLEDVLSSIHQLGIDTTPGKGTSLPTKSQRHGTCSFVNTKSAIMGMLYLLKLEECHDEDLATKYAKKHYKNFTHDMRDNYLSELLEEFNLCQKETDPDTYDLYLNLMAEVILAHHGQTKPNTTYDRSEKKSQETRRAFGLINSLKGEARTLLLSKLAKKGLFPISIMETVPKPIEVTDLKTLVLSTRTDITPPAEIFINVNTLLQDALEKSNKEVLQFMVTMPEIRESLNMKAPIGAYQLPPFMYAVDKEDFDMARLMILGDASIFDTDPQFGYSALTNAIFLQKKEQVEYLVNQLQMNVNYPDDRNRSAWQLIVEKDDRDMAKLFVNNQRVIETTNASAEKGHEPILLAIQHLKPHLLQLFLSTNLKLPTEKEIADIIENMPSDKKDSTEFLEIQDSLTIIQKRLKEDKTLLFRKSSTDHHLTPTLQENIPETQKPTKGSGLT